MRFSTMVLVIFIIIFLLHKFICEKFWVRQFYFKQISISIQSSGNCSLNGPRSPSEWG